ncbi:hypothetical protein PanWU01x14_203320 [Parasponia andersonii]|uniref:Uncharacterized protein n=1 Tax=Parasponia andersonii TaxID=3476 RepID=A0A2P5BWX7_PARAD|nr:hypothetical protein PanWU01x14_203320 [Parasponia andersonii]
MPAIFINTIHTLHHESLILILIVINSMAVTIIRVISDTIHLDETLGVGVYPGEFLHQSSEFRSACLHFHGAGYVHHFDSLSSVPLQLFLGFHRTNLYLSIYIYIYN